MFETGVACVVVDGENLTLEAVRAVAEEGAPVSLTDAVVTRAHKSRRILRGLAGEAGPEESVRQANLVRSHSTGVGPLFGEDEARAVLLARLNSLAKGYSGVRPEVLARLARYLNHGITPAVPEIGSLGAGGDAVPLAHLAATLIGEGQVLRDGKRVDTARVLGELGLAPLTLGTGEGRALIGGGAGATGLGALVVVRALDQVRQAEIAAALATEAMGGTAGPFLPAGHDLARPHLGQIDTAANLRALLRGGAADAVGPAGAGTGRGAADPGPAAQRAYALRAVPQVLGAVRHTLYQAVGTLETELNSAGEDPLYFEERMVFHGANGQGQAVAFALDFVTISLVQLGVLAERQVHRLLDPDRPGGLPPFLVAGDPALHHGFAGVRFPVAALVAENRTIGPASVQSVPAAGDPEDVAGLGLLAVRGARRVLENNNRILAVEFLAAAQAVDLGRRFDALGPAAQAAYDAVRSLVPALGVDRVMSEDIELITTALSRGELLRAVGRYGGAALR